MITQKAKELRETIDSQPGRKASHAQSTALFDELVDNCDPTGDEYNTMLHGVVLGGGALYRMIVKVAGVA